MTAAAEVKRPRGRPRIHIPVVAPSSPAAAVAALELADKRELELSGETPAPAAIPDGSRGEGENPLSTESPSSASGSPAPKKSFPPPRPPAGVDGDRSVPLSGKKYRDLNRDQLRTALAIADNERTDLRAQLAKAAPPVAAAAVDERMLQRACGETFGAIAGMLALKFGDDIRLAERDRDALGSAWAPVVAQWMREHPDSFAKQMPLFAAVSVTAGVGLEKFAIVRAKRAAAPGAPV